MTLPLDGIRVMDFSQVQQGPSCTLVLADFGADVTKIEPVGTGEVYRGKGDGTGEVRGFSGHFLCLNRNKKSIAVDLKQPAGKEIVFRLAKVSDVLVENYRPGVMDRLGIGYDVLKQINPRLIYACSSGYGQTGPYSQWKGQDVIGQAVAGIPIRNGYDDAPPICVLPPLADFLSGQKLTEGILLALLVRERSGVGQKLETALVNAMVEADMQRLTRQINRDKSKGGAEERIKRTDIWPYAFYKTKSGPMIMATRMFTKNALSRYCAALGIEDLTPRYPDEKAQNEHGSEIHAALQEAFLARPTTEWLDILGKHDLVAAPLNSPDELIEDPQVRHNDMIIEVEHPFGGTYKTPGFAIKMYDTPAQVRFGPPRLGQHTDETLAFLGYTPAEIEQLVQDKTVQRAPERVSVGAPSDRPHPCESRVK